MTRTSSCPPYSFFVVVSFKRSHTDGRASNQLIRNKSGDQCLTHGPSDNQRATLPSELSGNQDEHTSFRKHIYLLAKQVPDRGGPMYV